MAENNKFNLKTVYLNFQSSLNSGNDVDIKLYCKAFDELCLFFNLLGSVFHFVVKDVHTKIKILEDHIKSESGEHYKTLNAMISYETNNNILNVKGTRPNGCRTLLRLHRAMDFIALFLEKLKEPSEEKMSDIAYNSYQTTLARYHTWLIRKGVGIAVYTLPTKEHLLKELGSDTTETIEDVDKLQEMLHTVYNTIQKHYEDNNILDLP